MSLPPELLELFGGVLEALIHAEGQAAGYLYIMEQCLALAVP